MDRKTEKSKESGVSAEKVAKELAGFIAQNRGVFGNSPVAKAVFIQGIREYIRDKTDCVDVIPGTSEKAKVILAELEKRFKVKLLGEPHCRVRTCYKNDPQLKDKIKGELAFEHEYPLSQFDGEECLKSEKAIKDILLKMYRPVWITKDENDSLNKKGWRSRRPENAYELCDITIAK